jgi:hypothetical protein
MKLISHRGNIKGPNSQEENKPEYIENAISMGYDVEIDIRYNTLDSQFYLGHDESQYLVEMYWLEKNIENLWIHCKNIEALYEFSKTENYNYFWHQTDDFTLTSKKYIWSYPGTFHTSNSIIVMPELHLNLEFFDDLKGYDCFGICSDYVGKLL